jgi:PBP1b-binding outer membrane lipoprotein LpoB
MKKLLLLLSLSLLLVSCGTEVEDTKEPIVENPVVEVEKVETNFGDLAEYINSELSEDKVKELNTILSERKERQVEVAELIKNATSETKDEVYASIVEKRKTCAGRILPFVSEEQKTNFIEYCEKSNVGIKEKLDNK